MDMRQRGHISLVVNVVDSLLTHHRMVYLYVEYLQPFLLALCQAGGYVHHLPNALDSLGRQVSLLF